MRARGHRAWALAAALVAALALASVAGLEAQAVPQAVPAADVVGRRLLQFRNPLDEAKKQAEKLLNGARDEANKIINGARDKANDVINGATRDAANIANAARAEAERVVHGAQAEAASLVASARGQADALIKQANDAAASINSRATAALEAATKARDDAQAALQKAREDADSLGAQAREQLAKADQARAEAEAALKKVADELARVDLTKQLRQWSDTVAKSDAAKGLAKAVESANLAADNLEAAEKAVAVVQEISEKSAHIFDDMEACGQSADVVSCVETTAEAAKALAAPLADALVEHDCDWDQKVAAFTAGPPAWKWAHGPRIWDSKVASAIVLAVYPGGQGAAVQLMMSELKKQGKSLVEAVEKMGESVRGQGRGGVRRGGVRRGGGGRVRAARAGRTTPSPPTAFVPRITQAAAWGGKQVESLQTILERMAGELISSGGTATPEFGNLGFDIKLNVLRSNCFNTLKISGLEDTKANAEGAFAWALAWRFKGGFNETGDVPAGPAPSST